MEERGRRYLQRACQRSVDKREPEDIVLWLEQAHAVTSQVVLFNAFISLPIAPYEAVTMV